MLILGIDTSGKNGSLALVRFDVGSNGDFAKFEALEVTDLAGGTYSAQLIPQLAAMLERHGIRKSAIDAYAVSSGPGSFTGLRVGLSTVKALADATGKPITAITVLEAIAWKTDVQGRIFIGLDAGRKQVFLGEFLAEGRMRTPLSQHLFDGPEFVQRIIQETVPLFTPDSTIAEMLGTAASHSSHTVTIVRPPRADLYARIGAERILAGNTISPAELDANYIRRSDAEIFFRGPR